MLEYSLSRKLTAERNVGVIQGIRSTKGIDTINRSLFADDSLLLGGASLRIDRAFQEIIQSFYIISGVLVNKIKPLLDKLISSSQADFIKGRHILDNVILVQEAMHSSFQRKEQGMLIKLDMSNAFDRVKLSYLYKFLLYFGFSPTFVNLIKSYTDKPWITPVVNGKPYIFNQLGR